MQFEDIIGPLSSHAANKEQARVILENLLLELAIRPITMNEKDSLETKILEFMKNNDVRDDSDVAKLVYRRLSYGFLPSITKIGINRCSRPSNDSERTEAENIASSVTIGKKVQVSVPATSPDLMSVETESSDDFKQAIYSTALPSLSQVKCTIKRIRATLRSSHQYLLYINSINDIKNNSQNILGSRKVKVGSSSQYLIWNTSDQSEWKDRNSIGKMIKLNHLSSYISKLNNDTKESSAHNAGIIINNTKGDTNSILISIKSNHDKSTQVIVVCGAEPMEDNALIDALDVCIHTNKHI